jgi:dephospho-CoA kinase
MSMLIIGLTGNFGMGKSNVLSAFRGLGAVTLDSDLIVGALLNETDVIAQIRDMLGDDVILPDGKLDKKGVAGKVFSNHELKGKLEALIHPLVFGRVEEFVGRIKEKDRIVIIEVPLLFEGKYEDRFKKIITVYAPEETAIGRLIDSGFSREEALARLRSQLPIEVKKERADYTIDNSGTREETVKQVEKIYELLLEEMKKEEC